VLPALEAAFTPVKKFSLFSSVIALGRPIFASIGSLALLRATARVKEPRLAKRNNKHFSQTTQEDE
jgi:hypothetical protein